MISRCGMLSKLWPKGGTAQVVRADEEFEVTFIGAEGQSREPARVETSVYQELAAADLATCKEVTSPADIAMEYRIASKGRRIYNEYFSPLQGEP